MRFRALIQCLLVFFCFAPGWGAMPVSHFPAQNFVRTLENIAKQEKLNIIINAPDCELKESFHAKFPIESFIRGISESAGCKACLIGNTFVIVEKKNLSRIERPELTFVSTDNRPVETLLPLIKGVGSAEGFRTFSIREENLAAVYGNPDDLTLVSDRIRELDNPGKLIRVSLTLNSGNQALIGKEFSFLTIDECPINLEISSNSGENLFATFMASAKDSEIITLKGTISDKPSQKLAQAEISDVFGKSEKSNKSFNFMCGSTKYSGSWGAEIISDSKLLRRSFPNRKKEETFARNEYTAPAPDAELEDFSIVNQPMTEVLEKIATSEGNNISCNEQCKDIVSVFCFGEKLYFEELLNLIAKTGGYATRKIGYMWLIAPRSMMADTFCSSLFVIKRLQYSSFAKLKSGIEKLLEYTEHTKNTRVAFSEVNNALIYGGSGNGIYVTNKFLTALDTTPINLAMNLSIECDSGNFQEKLESSAGETFSGKLSADNSSFAYQLLPILLGNKGNFALHYEISKSFDRSEVKISGWSYLSEDANDSIVSITGNLPLEVKIGAKISSSKLHGMTNLRESFEKDSPTTMEDEESSFDKAFDSSF